MDPLHSLLLSSQSLIHSLPLDCIKSIARVFDTLTLWLSMADACLCILSELKLAFIVSYLIATTLGAHSAAHPPSLDPIPIESLSSFHSLANEYATQTILTVSPLSIEHSHTSTYNFYSSFSELLFFIFFVPVCCCEWPSVRTTRTMTTTRNDTLHCSCSTTMWNQFTVYIVAAGQRRQLWWWHRKLFWSSLSVWPNLIWSTVTTAQGASLSG